MHSINDSDGLRPTRTRVSVPLNTDETAIPKVLRLDTKQRTDLVTNLAISVLTDRALVITRKPSPNLISDRIEEFGHMLNGLRDNAALVVHRLNVTLRPHASSKAWVTMRDAIARVPHKDNASVRIISDLPDVSAQGSLIRIDSAKMRVANRVEVHMRGRLREVLADSEQTHYTTALTKQTTSAMSRVRI